MDTVLGIRNLTKSYGKRLALCDVSVDIYAGEIFGFLGPNGAGKTTLIKAAVGLTRPDKGSVSICGHDLKTQFCEAVRNVGAIIENPDMYSYLTAYQNLEYFAAFYGGIGGDRIWEVLKQVGLEAHAHEKIGRYSLGMRQRLGIAQALLHRPKVLILDEPTNGLDPDGIREIRDLFKAVARDEGTAVFISSHILSEMQLMCDRVGVINHGKLLMVSSLEELTHAARSDRTVRLKTDDDARAAEMAAEMGIEARAENGLTLTLARERIPALNRALVEAGLNVFGLYTSEKSLEDIYMELIGQGGAA